jgi:hypothetical protein
MPRTRKYQQGQPVTSLDEAWAMIRAGEYFWDGAVDGGRPVNPGWAASWMFSMFARYIEKGRIFRAAPYTPPEKE